MVGFGSSLRMSRRPGWEGAYLDYETLKLLLSQIEAVYEEEGHRQRRVAAGFGGGGHHHEQEDEEGRNKPSVVRDYRLELFECDSDEAYASVNEYEEAADDDDNDIIYSQQHQRAQQHPVGFVGGSGGSTEGGIHGGQTSNKPFLLSYSQEESSSEDEEGENRAGGCGAGVSFSPWTTSSWDHQHEGSTNPHRKPKKRRNKSSLSALEEGDTFYMKGPNTNNTFYLTGGEESASYFQQGTSTSNQPASILSAPVQAAGETSALLSHTKATTTGGSAHHHHSSSLYSFSSTDPMTPPRPLSMYPSASSEWVDYSSSPTLPLTGTKSGSIGGTSSTSNTQQSHQKQPVLTAEDERKRQRRERRKIRRNKKKKNQSRDRQVPRHLRVAHAKARAITERFLGLLRAETEKILLFAESRLGELADTAGSLRFPSLEDNDYVPNSKKAHQQDARAAASPFDYPLSDGGLHPSASSSEDEGAGPNGSFPWSEFSDDEEERSHASQQQRINASAPSAFGTGAISDDTLNRSNRSKTTPPQTLNKGRMNNIMLKTNAAVRRQIDHFTELRRRRPVFLRNEQVLGEDMLLISAVEEADGYTAVGVELMHVLRYICVNLIAVRKICRKHDRLLMNRMLGGYYRRTKRHHGSTGRYSHIEDTNTLGGQIANYDANPALTGNMTHYKLIGIYDKKIQKLANSRTVQVISSCLALALSESEVTRSRADALTKLNSAPMQTQHQRGGRPPLSAGASRPESGIERVLSDDEGLSTASSISLTRLQFAVTSIFALREAARYKVGHYNAYLSRSMLTFTGRPVVGEGLDGCSRETLDFLVAYNPDSVLLHDISVLFEGLRRGRWNDVPQSDLMVSSLVVGATPVNIPADAAPALLQSEELAVVNAVSVEPESRMILERLLNGQLSNATLDRPSSLAPDLFSRALRLNRITLFLFMMNYFTAHATTDLFVFATGIPPAFASIVIGSPNISAILAAIVQCMVLSKDQLVQRRSPEDDVGFVRCLLAISAVTAVAGNIVHALAVNNGSVQMAVLGRFIYGFSSCEILHRQLVAACRPSQVVLQASRLVQFRVLGIVTGLILGCLAEAVPITIKSLGIRAMQSTSWIMTILWAIHFARVLIQLRGVPDDRRKPNQQEEEHGTVTPVESDDNGYDSSDSEQISTPTSVLYHSSSPITSDDPFIDAYGGAGEKSPQSTDGQPRKPSGLKEHRKSGCRQLKSVLHRLRRLLLGYHVGIPIAMFIVVYVNYAFEAFFTGTPLMTYRYFGWRGVHACAFLAGLAMTILPINLICEFISRRYEERTVLKRSLIVVVVGLVFMLNFGSLFSLAQRVPKLFNETTPPPVGHGLPSHPYDWKFGIIQYVIGLMITFVGLISLEGAALSLLSKLAPLRLRSIVINVGTISVFLSFTARILADAQILFVGLSHRLINTDMVNAVAIPLLLVAFPILYLVRKHYFFLI